MSAKPSRRADALAPVPVPVVADVGSAPGGAASPGLRADGRLGVRYALSLGRDEDAHSKAVLIGLEQTVELPRQLVAPGLAESRQRERQQGCKNRELAVRIKHNRT